MPRLTSLQLREKIGKGAFSEVFKGELTEIHTVVAVKVLTSIADCIKEEINYLQSFSHPNIIHFYGTIQTDKLIIVTEYMDCTLDDLLYHQHTLAPSLQFDLTEQIKIHISIEIGKGIRYLQQLSLIHGDIKPENILIDSNLNVKLNDFGLTKRPIECSDNIHGTPNYLPPETFVYNEYNLTCDIYAYAMVIWQIFTQRLLYVKYNTMEDLSMKIWDGERPPLTKSIPKCYHSLLSQMWSKDIAERPKINDILITLSEAYLDGFSNAKVKNQWRMLCNKYYDGIIQREIPVDLLKREQKSDMFCDNVTMIGIKHFDLLSVLFGDMLKEQDVRKMNAFLTSIPTEFHWDERYLVLDHNGFMFKVREDLFDDDRLEVENLKSGRKISIKSIYHLIN